jgi:hypothetical protein
MQTEQVKNAVTRVYGSVAAKEDSGQGHQEGARRVAQAFGYSVHSSSLPPSLPSIISIFFKISKLTQKQFI